ncbi:hypothetical protein ACA910_010736 [Epithemia clementina (nom. ined.)]
MGWSNFELLQLPLELKRRVASFLDSRDAISMARTCKTMNLALPLTRLEPVRPLFATYRRSGDVATGDNWFRAFRLPVLNRRVHSMRIEFFWRDQGWGNRKTECRIVGYPLPVTDTPSRYQNGSQFGGGRVVAASPGFASHDEERLRLTFNPLENEYYHLWYKVGGGGGHVMFLRQGSLQTVIFDDEFRNLARNYRVLFAEGVLCREVEGEIRQRNSYASLFFPRMLISVSRALRRQLQGDTSQEANLRLELEAFLAEYSIPLNVGSLVALEEIIQADIEERLFQRNQVLPANDDDGNHGFLVPLVDDIMEED